MARRAAQAITSAAAQSRVVVYSSRNDESMPVAAPAYENAPRSARRAIGRQARRERRSARPRTRGATRRGGRAEAGGGGGGARSSVVVYGGDDDAAGGRRKRRRDGGAAAGGGGGGGSAAAEAAADAVVWSECWSDSRQRIFYVNKATREKVWRRPERGTIVPRKEGGRGQRLHRRTME